MRYMVLIFTVIKVNQLPKTSGTNFWSAFSGASDDPKKSHRLSLQLHDPNIAKQ